MARQVISLAMLPIYTRVLLPSDYGAVEAITLITTLASLLLTVNLGEAIFKLTGSAEGRSQRDQIVYTALIVVVGLNVLAFFLLSITAPLLSEYFLVERASLWPLLCLNAFALITEAVSAIAFTQMRIEGKVWHFFTYSMVKMGLQLIANIVFVVILRLGALGIVLSHVSASLVICLLVMVPVLRSSGARFSRPVGMSLLSIGIPLTLSTAIGYYVVSSDRLFLSAMSSLAVVGTYALAVRLSQVLVSLIYEPFEQVWDPEKYRIWERHKDPAPIQTVFLLVAVGVVFFGLAMAVFAKEIFMLISGPQFWAAADVAPPLIAAAALTILTRFCRFGILLGGRMTRITAAAAIAGVLLTALLAVFVPRFGAQGAAWSVCAAAAVRLVLEEFWARKSVNLGLPWLRVSGVCVIATCTYLLIQFISADGMQGVAVKVVVCCASSAIAWFSPLIREPERALVRRYLRRRPS